MIEDKNKSRAFGGQSGGRATGVGVALNPYVQVALTYVRRPFSSPQGWALSVIFLLLGTGVLLRFLESNRDMGADYPPMGLLVPLVAIVLVATHVKNQFADSRAHLTPNFRRVHATVAAAAAFLLAVVLPLALIWVADLRSVGLVALTVFLLGLILYQTTHPNLLSWLLVLVIIAPLATPTRILMWQLVSGEFEAHAVALLALGATLAVVGGVKLFALNEDMPVYKPTWFGWAGTRTTGGARVDAWLLPAELPESFMENDMARWTYHAQRASTSRWSAVCRWQVGMPNGWKSWLFGVGVVLAVQFAAWIFVRGRLEPAAFFWSTYVVWLIVVPSFRSVARCPFGYEIMLPVERRTYLKQAGMAVAISCLRTWGGMVTAFMLWWVTYALEPLRFGLVVNVLACSVLAQVGLFGIGRWLALLAKPDSSSQIMLCLVVGAFWAVLGPPMLLVGHMLHESPPGLGNLLLPLAGTGLFAMFGLLLTWFTYHRWLVADFD